MVNTLRVNKLAILVLTKIADVKYQLSKMKSIIDMIKVRYSFLRRSSKKYCMMDRWYQVNTKAHLSLRNRTWVCHPRMKKPIVHHNSIKDLRSKFRCHRTQWRCRSVHSFWNNLQVHIRTTLIWIQQKILSLYWEIAVFQATTISKNKCRSSKPAVKQVEHLYQKHTKS